MYLKRAVGVSLVNYLISGIFGIIMAAVAGINFQESNDIPDSFFLVGMLVILIVTPLLTKWYFKSPKTKPSMQAGLKLAGVFFIVAIILDLAFILPAVATGNAPADPFGYYMNIYFWISIIIMFAAAGLTGKQLIGKNLSVDTPAKETNDNSTDTTQ